MFHVFQLRFDGLSANRKVEKSKRKNGKMKEKKGIHDLIVYIVHFINKQ